MIIERFCIMAFAADTEDESSTESICTSIDDKNVFDANIHELGLSTAPKNDKTLDKGLGWQ